MPTPVSQEIETPPRTKKPSVPWTGFDVLLFIVLWLMAQVVVGVAMVVVDFAVRPQVQAAADESAEDHGHPIAQLVQLGKTSPIVLLLTFLFAVVAAPLFEEFLFRLLFQGWLESALARFHIPWASGIAIVTVSLCFAAIHGGNSGDLNLQTLLCLSVATIVLNLLIFTFGMVYLAWIRDLKITDYLFGTERFFHPKFFINVKYCLLAIALCLGLNGFSVVLDWAVPNTNTSPIPIFFFALVLGTVYSRTKNLSYCVLLHACLNLTSLLLLVLFFT